MENLLNIGKILLAQINTISCNVEFNKNQAIKAIEQGIEKECEMIIFPKNFLVSNNTGNALERFSFIYEQAQNAINELIEYSSKIAILIGCIDDEFYFLNNLAKLKIEKKSSMVFDFKNVKFQILACNEEKKENVDIVLDLNPYYSKYLADSEKNGEILKYIKKNNVKYIFLNQIGGYDEFVYAGASRYYDEFSNLKACAKYAEEENLVIDLNEKTKIDMFSSKMLQIQDKKAFSLDYSDDLERTYKTIVLGLRDYFSKNGFERAILGLSGGLDSTICSVLLADAIGNKNVLGVFMPSKLTSSQSQTDARELAKNLGINYIEVPIKEMQSCISNNFENNFSKISNFWNDKFLQSYTQDNIQARLRAMILWGIANEYPKAITIATSDKSEGYMGYATINGDMSGGIAPIIDVTKTKLFALASWINEYREFKNAIPQNIIEKPPGAELAINPETGKTLLAEEALMPYEFMDEVIYRIENLNQTFDIMLNDVFLYEKSYKINIETKKNWLKKFFRCYNNAIYKGYILPPSIITDKNTNNKARYKQYITSKIEYYE